MKNMKLNKLIITLLSFVAMLSACAPENLDRYYDEVKAEPSYIVLDNMGDTTEVLLTTTDNWTITNIPEWLKVEPASGSAAPDGVVVTLSALKAYEALSVELSVNVGTVSQTIYVTQPMGEIPPTPIQEVVESGVDGRTYKVQGTVSNISNTLYGNFYLKDSSVPEGEDGLYIYGMLDANGATKNFLSLGIEEGDEILITGPRKDYNGTIELVDASLVEIVNKALVGAEKNSFVIADTAGTLSVPLIVKGENLTITVKEGEDWLKFEGVEAPGNALFSFSANTEAAARTATFTASSAKDTTVSELNITVKQTPAAPAVKKVSEINFSGKEYVTIEGTVAALSSKGFVLYDGNTAEGVLNKVYVTASGAEEYALGDTVRVIGASSFKNSLNQVTVDLMSVKKFEGEYTYPEAAELDADNASAVAAEKPAAVGYYQVTGLLSADKNLCVPGTDYEISALDLVSSINLKNFYGKYVTVCLYNVDFNSKYNQIVGIWTSVEESEDEAPAYINLAYTSDDLEWNETEAKITIETTLDWTASVSGVEGVTLSKESGSGNGTIEVSFDGINNTYEEEEAVVEIIGVKKAESKLNVVETADTCYYTITRAAKVLELSGAKTVSYEEQDVVLSIAASKFWRVELEGEGATLDKTEGYMTDAIVVSIPENRGETELTYTVTLIEDRVSGEPQTFEFVITQKFYVEEIDYTSMAELSQIVVDGTKNYEVMVENAVVSYVNGKTVFIEDATGAIILYFSDHGLTAGQKITGKISGTCDMYNGVPQLLSIDYSAATVESGASIPCTTVTIANLLANYDRYVSCRVLIKGVEVTDGLNLEDDRDGEISQNGEKIALRSQDKYTVVVEAGQKGDLICYPTKYKENLQVGIWSNDDFVAGEGGEDETPVPGDGTLENPYSASEALALINAGNNTTDKVYVEGIISKIDNVNTEYGNATYYISEDGTETNHLQIFRGKYIDGEKFTSEDQIKVGDSVVVLGELIMYGGTTPEMPYGNIVSHN